MRPTTKLVVPCLLLLLAGLPASTAAGGQVDGASLVWEAVVSGGSRPTLSLPVAVASAGAEQFAVADADPPRLILVQRATGGWSFGKAIPLPGVPLGLTATSGAYFVSLRGNGALYAFSPDQSALRRVPLPRGVFAGALAPDGAGGLAVVDLGGSRLLHLSPAGARLGEIELPRGARRVWPLDSGWLALIPQTGRILPLAADGSAGAPEALPAVNPRPCWPVAIAVDGDGARWILDRSGARVLVLDAKGRLLAEAGRRGWNEGRLLYPADMALIGDDRVAVVDQFNRRVQVFHYLREGSQQ